MPDRLTFVLVAIWIIVAATPLYLGWSFYTTPVSHRPDSPLYDSFKPSGLVSHGLGIAGTLMLAVGVSLYIARKRVVWMQRFGKLRDWLRFHIFLCTLGPYLVLLHTTFKLGNVASVAFWSMTIVVVSGVFGRYIYHHIPKTADGEFFTEGELLSRTMDAIRRVREMTGVSVPEMDQIVASVRRPRATGLTAGIKEAILADLRGGKRGHTVLAALRSAGVPTDLAQSAVPVLLDGLRYEQRRGILVPMQRLFGYWHVFHIPLALVMLLALLIHIGVAIAFGYHWVF